MTQRVFAEMIGRPFQRGLLFPYFLFLPAASAADAGTILDKKLERTSLGDRIWMLITVAGILAVMAHGVRWI